MSTDTSTEEQGQGGEHQFQAQLDSAGDAETP